MDIDISHVLSFIASLFFFLPAAIILLKRMGSRHGFYWFAMYWAFSGLINLIDSFANLPQEWTSMMGRIFNLIDAPLILGVLLLTTRAALLRRSLQIVLPILLFSAVLVALVWKFADPWETGQVGVGLASTLVFIIWALNTHIGKVEHNPCDRTMIYLLSGLLFASGLSIIIYFFAYLVPDYKKYIDGNFLLYYLTTCISTGIGATGLILYKEAKRRPVGRDRSEEIMYI